MFLDSNIFYLSAIIVVGASSIGSWIWLALRASPRGRSRNLSPSPSLKQEATEEKRNIKPKILEEQLNTDQLCQLISLGQMAAGVSHEINNPLSVVVGSVDALIEDIGDKEMNKNKLLSRLESVKKTTINISHIVRAMHSFSKDVSSQPPCEVNVKDIVSDVLSLSRQKIRHAEIDLKINFESMERLQLRCRRGEITQVLVNLLLNARDAIATLKERWIQLYCENMGSDLRIHVVDSGKGIAPELKEKIFEPFFTTKQSIGGTGLGLDICRNLVSKNGGNIFVNEESKNTHFVVQLPVEAAMPYVTQKVGAV